MRVEIVAANLLSDKGGNTRVVRVWESALERSMVRKRPHPEMGLRKILR